MSNEENKDYPRANNYLYEDDDYYADYIDN